MRKLFVLILFACYCSFYAQTKGELKAIKKAKEDSTNEIIKKLDKEVELNPKDDYAYYRRAKVKYDLAYFLKQEGDWRGVIKDYDMVTKLGSKYSDTAYYMIGIVRWTLFNYLLSDYRSGTFYDEFAKAVEINPKYVAPYYQMGLSMRQTNLPALSLTENKKYNKAIEAFTKVIELSPNPYVARAYSQRADCKMELMPADKDGACADWNKSAELGDKNAKSYVILHCKFDPKSADDYYKMGTQNMANDKKKAIEYFTKAIELDPKHAEAYYNRGYCNHKLKKKEEACMDWKKADELGSQYASGVLEKYC